MKNSFDKSFYHKLYIVIGLSSVIVCGLLYLVFSGGAERIYNVNGNQTAATTATPTTTPVQTSAPQASVSTQPTTTPTVTPTVVDTTTNTSIQKIVNFTHTISEDYVPTDLVQPSVASNGEQLLRKEAAAALEKMFTAAENDGISLYLVSGYRSYELQQSLYYTYIDEYGQEYTDHIDATPGASEHQLGLSVDLGLTNHACELYTCFSTTDAYTWLQKNAATYGYILRHPENTEDITGIVYSPWSYRYVGSEATKIVVSGKVLEEYYSN